MKGQAGSNGAGKRNGVRGSVGPGSPSDLEQILRIPVADYLGVLVIAGGIALVLRVYAWLKPGKGEPELAPEGGVLRSRTR